MRLLRSSPASSSSFSLSLIPRTWRDAPLATLLFCPQCRLARDILLDRARSPLAPRPCYPCKTLRIHALKWELTVDSRPV